MEAPKTLRPPENWQDFETLCKKLWSEIWNCSEIKKNGRSGQNQNGVDIYGIPYGEKQYYGIQCKLKNEYQNKSLTQDEISSEIEKAKKFKPALKKLYVTTTATKDVKLEQFVRRKNLENIETGFFEVHLFSWEDIVDLIEENQHTRNWYLKNQNFRINRGVKITFYDDSVELTISPKYSQKNTYFLKKKVEETSLTHLFNRDDKSKKPLFQIEKPIPTGSKTNLSYCKLSFKIFNTGTEPIERYKLLFHLEGGILDMINTNEVHIGKEVIKNIIGEISNVQIDSYRFKGVVYPRESILVGDDFFISDYFFIKPSNKECEIIVKWKLISLNFKEEGTLRIKVTPVVKKIIKTVYVENSNDVRVETDEIEDYIICNE